jgi:hypothetical protein
MRPERWPTIYAGAPLNRASCSNRLIEVGGPDDPHGQGEASLGRLRLSLVRPPLSATQKCSGYLRTPLRRGAVSGTSRCAPGKFARFMRGFNATGGSDNASLPAISLANNAGYPYDVPSSGRGHTRLHGREFGYERSYAPEDTSREKQLVTSALCDGIPLEAR